MKTVKIRFDSIENIEKKYHGMECTLNNPVIEDISELAIESLLSHIDTKKLFKEIVDRDEDLLKDYLKRLDDDIKYFGLSRNAL